MPAGSRLPLSYDGAGNRKTRVDKRTNTTLTFGYDNIYQLLTAKQGSTTKESYTYDLVGNRLSSLGVSPYNYNSSNELTSLPSGSYSYDKNGNTQTKPDGTQYTWDINNELTQVVLPGTGGTVNFLYDPFGRRIQKSFTQNGTTTTTDYLYDGPNRIEDLANNNGTLTLTARYVDTLGIDEPLEELISGTASYYEQDGLGSVTSLSNSSGALVNTYSYDSYGKLLASTGTTPNPFQYTGREFDAETGAYYYRARYYDQNVGRFISEDPIGFKGGVDFYAYVKNKPTRLMDPTGECPPGDPCSPPPIFDSVSAHLFVCPCLYRGNVEKICDCLGLPFGQNGDPEFMKQCQGCFGGQKSPRAACKCACALSGWVSQAKCNAECNTLPDK